MFKYDTEIDVENAGTSHALIVDLVGHNKRVLDVGCATGYLAKVLQANGCTVSGAEMDKDAAAQAEVYLDQLVIGDLETLDLRSAFQDQRFDVVVFGDVLEHLRDPLRTLRQGRALLAPGGSVVVSVPNVAHGAIRLALLRGEFTYRPLGLLDSTHLRFFTRDGLETLMRDAGLVMVDTRRSVAGIFETEQALKPEDFDPQLVTRLLEDIDATTYQFVVRAVVDDGTQAVRDLAVRAREQQRRIYELELEVAAAKAALADQQGLAAAAEDSREAADARVRAIEESFTFRALRVPRRIYGGLRRLR